MKATFALLTDWETHKRHERLNAELSQRFGNTQADYELDRRGL